VAVSQKSRDNATPLVTENEARATASDSEASSVPVEPTPEESESVGGQDEGSVPQESPENTAQLVAEDNTHETVPGSEAPLAPVKPVREGSTPGRGQEEGLLPKDGKDPAAGITVKDEMRANATDFKDFSAPVSSVSDRSRLVGTDSIEPTITELLARAERQIAAKQLVTPAGDSALETYESILALVPGHSGASRGIDRIKEIYLTWAGAARQRGQLAKAQSYAQRAATVDPQDRGVARLLDQIKAERKLKAEMAALKKEDVEKAKAAVTPVEEAKALRKPDVETLRKPTPRPPAAAHAPDSLSSDLLAQRVSEIDSLLITAQQQFDAQHLTQPAGDNAWETYQKVLQLDPTNQRAREGLQRIVQRIEFTARGKQQNGDLLKSLAIIEEGLRVMPNHSGLSALKEEVNREIEAQRAATQAEEQPAPTTDKEEPPEPKKKKRRRVKTFGTFF
jgi:tetratricopeptide (TPR) repeat protein